MVCKVCEDMLSGHKGRRDSAVSQLQLSFWHHDKEDHVRASAKESECYLCRVIYDRLKALGLKTPSRKEKAITQSQFLSASLRSIPRRPRTYRLSFQITETRQSIANFVLQENASDFDHLSEAPISAHTSDPPVIKMAREWIEQCAAQHPGCVQQSSAKLPWYPTRLIDVRFMRDSQNKTKAVRLVSSKIGEKKIADPQFEGRYVTLSHRWGNKPFTKLTEDKLPEFQEAILVRDLPCTFQDAIRFACELKEVRWIWIDALCILQDSDKDWLYESSVMDQVYTHSFCNISATAAMDNSEGLFRSRDQKRKWVDTVYVKTEDLSVTSQPTVECTISDLEFWDEKVENAPANKRSWVLQERLLAPRVIHWCNDQIAFECREMDRAECRPGDLPHFQMRGGELIDQARLKGISVQVGRSLMETRLANEYGLGSWQGSVEMDELDPKFFLYEIWKRVVEQYTRMELTEKRDRLIALSGIARMMKSTLDAQRSDDTYLAGLWQNYLASQLLWHVNDLDNVQSQPFENTRPAEKRAPTFSWASVETERGVTFPETTDKGLLIQVQVVRLTYRTPDDKFGLVTDGYLVVKGVLRKVQLVDRANDTARSESCSFLGYKVDWHAFSIVSLAPALFLATTVLLSMLFWKLLSGQRLPWITFVLASCVIAMVLRFGTSKTPTRKPDNTKLMDVTNRYFWRLVKNGVPSSKLNEIVYLDSPASAPSVFDADSQVFCLPALQDERHLWCLLLQATDGDHGIRYQRVGITKILNIWEDEVNEIKEPPGDNQNPLGEYYWGSEGRVRNESTICII
ncbi:hypothetical protein PV05_11334 [Exophiala xenobiotica]|uniref:Heterokaryon incompatibility domain-containing protein n=1 Tax=Exophiala xenobiotica TaxID=348802 RepID=A0A0D2E4K0_9EURO|nr:uncharacterized protein PV05_11334 [Exophiala xenobiotica]KIW49680.1 hypothetical protein PV05_11334 [Exophiala xenobiotica]